MKFLEHKERRRRRERQKILFQSHNFSFQEIRGHESRNLFNCGTFRLNMAKFRNGKYQKIIRFHKIKVCRFQMEIVWICLYRGGQEIISFPGFAGTLITLKSCPCINNQTSSKLKKLNISHRTGGIFLAPLGAQGVARTVLQSQVFLLNHSHAQILPSSLSCLKHTPSDGAENTLSCSVLSTLLNTHQSVSY